MPCASDTTLIVCADCARYWRKKRSVLDLFHVSFANFQARATWRTRESPVKRPRTRNVVERPTLSPVSLVDGKSVTLRLQCVQRYAIRMQSYYNRLVHFHSHSILCNPTTFAMWMCQALVTNHFISTSCLPSTMTIAFAVRKLGLPSPMGSSPTLPVNS